MLLTGSYIKITQNPVSSTEKLSIFRSKTLTVKNKNKKKSFFYRRHPKRAKVDHNYSHQAIFPLTLSG